MGGHGGQRHAAGVRAGGRGRRVVAGSLRLVQEEEEESDSRRQEPHNCGAGRVGRLRVGAGRGGRGGRRRDAAGHHPHQGGGVQGEGGDPVRGAAHHLPRRRAEEDEHHVGRHGRHQERRQGAGHLRQRHGGGQLCRVRGAAPHGTELGAGAGSGGRGGAGGGAAAERRPRGALLRERVRGAGHAVPAQGLPLPLQLLHRGQHRLDLRQRARAHPQVAHPLHRQNVRLHLGAEAAEQDRGRRLLLRRLRRHRVGLHLPGPRLGPLQPRRLHLHLLCGHHPAHRLGRLAGPCSPKDCVLRRVWLLRTRRHHLQVVAQVGSAPHQKAGRALRGLRLHRRKGVAALPHLDRRGGRRNNGVS